MRSGPWFGADFEAGVWIDVPLALGFLKVTSGPEQYALRVAHVGTAVETAYTGEFPSVSTMGHRGSVVLGVGADSSNNSFSTFFEGAIVAACPDDAIEQAVLENIQAVGYGE